MTNVSGSTPVRPPSSINPHKNHTNLTCSETTVQWPHFCCWQLRPMFIQSCIVNSKSHKIGTPSMPFRNRTSNWIGHSRSFKVIFIGISRNQEQGVLIMHINVVLISESYEDIATGKLQIHWVQPWSIPLRFDNSSSRKAFECQEITENPVKYPHTPYMPRN